MKGVDTSGCNLAGWHAGMDGFAFYSICLAAQGIPVKEILMTINFPGREEEQSVRLMLPG